MGKRLSALVVVAVLVTSGLAGTVGARASASSPDSRVWPLLIAPTHRQGLFYLLTSQTCGKTRCLHLYRTRDIIDRTWDTTLRLAQVKMPPYGRLARTQQGTVMAMVFTTPKIGYVLEGNSEAQRLYVTRNGAHSWQRSPIPRNDTIWGLTATSTHLYALFVHCSSVTHGCDYMELVHAPLRATHWRGVKIPFAQFSERPLGQVTGYGEMMMFAETSKNGGKIYVSHNRGEELFVLDASQPQEFVGLLSDSAGCPTSVGGVPEKVASSPAVQ